MAIIAMSEEPAEAVEEMLDVVPGSDLEQIRSGPSFRRKNATWERWSSPEKSAHRQRLSPSSGGRCG
jgi:hypothetical protein